MKKIILIMILISLILSGCSQTKVNYKNHKEQSLFVENEFLEQDIQKKQTFATLALEKTEELKIKPPISISIVDGKEKLNIISDKFPEFYGQLYKKFLSYEQGKIKDFIDVFFSYSTDTDFLFNRYVDAQITSNTKITIANTYLNNNKLTIDVIVEYIPVFFNMLKSNKNIEDITNDYLRYSKIDSQRDFFTLEFDISKFSSSEGIKIKNYANKDAIIRSLTSSFYGANKEFVQCSNENRQQDVSEILKSLKPFNFENLSKIDGISPELEKMVLDNGDLSKFIYDSVEIQSVNTEYLMVSYPNVKTYILEHSPTIEELMIAISENKIGTITRLIYDPEFLYLYKMINNMFL